MGSAGYALAATLAIQLLVSMAVLTVPVLAPVAAAGIGLSAGLIGVYTAIVYGASMAATLVAGAMVQRFGAIRVSQACLLLSAAGLACVASGTPATVAFGAIVLGLGYGPVTPASSHVLAKTTPPRMMSLVFSIKQTGVPLGGAVAGLVVPALVVSSGWREAALVVAAACVATIFIAQPLRASLDADRDASSRLGAAGLTGPLRYTMSHPTLRRLAACSFCFAALQMCLVSYLVTYLVGPLGISLVQAGLMLTVAQSGGVVGRIAWGGIADRLGRPMQVLGALAIAMGISAAATAAFTPQWPALAVAIACAVFGATAIGWNGVFLAEVARCVPAAEAGIATGGSLTFTYAGVLVGPALFALMVEHGVSYPAAFLAAAVPAVACGAWLLVPGKRARS